jgi:hypothetical protein
MDRVFQHLHMPVALAIEFIAVFSRMEHALKSTGYALGNEGKVVPAWDKFANEINEQFEQRVVPVFPALLRSIMLPREVHPM